MSFLLNHMLVGRVQIPSMLHQRMVDAKCLLGAKSENVLAFPQETNQGASNVITHLVIKLNCAVEPPFFAGDDL